jgi:hypothetical protein
MADDATARQLLERADQRWRAQAGSARFEDAPIRPAPAWRYLPPPTMWTASSTAAMCADARQQNLITHATTARKLDGHKVRELWSQGRSDGDISKALGFSKAAVSAARRRMGLPTHFKGCGRAW